MDSHQKERLKSLVLQLAPQSEIIVFLQELKSWPQTSVQEILVEVLTHPHVVQFPPPIRWKRHLLKLVDQSLESVLRDPSPEYPEEQQQYSDALVELIIETQARFSACNGDDEDAGYMSYIKIPAEESTACIVTNKLTCEASCIRPPALKSNDAAATASRTIEVSSEPPVAQVQQRQLLNIAAATEGPGIDIATLRVVRSHNQVGTRVWGAGVYLGELFQRWVRHYPMLFQQQIVVELGAGVGITGLMLSKLVPSPLQPKRIIMTDFHPDVVSVMQHNVGINQCPRLSTVADCSNNSSSSSGGNFIDVSGRSMTTSNATCISGSERDPSIIPPTHTVRGCMVDADTLDWSSVQEEDFRKYGARFLFAADCTYSKDGNVYLVQALSRFLRAVSSEEGEISSRDCTSHKVVSSEEGEISSRDCTSHKVVSSEEGEISSRDCTSHKVVSSEEGEISSRDCTSHKVATGVSMIEGTATSTGSSVSGIGSGGSGSGSDGGGVGRGDSRSGNELRSANCCIVEALRSARQPFILIACTLRNQETYEHFTGLVDADSSMQRTDVTAWARQTLMPYPFYFYHEDIDSIQLLCIYSAIMQED